MAQREVLHFPDDRLRKIAKPVSNFDQELKDLVADMFDTMYAEDGIGLAAPQIGVDKRVVVMDVTNEDGSNKKLALINPVIVKKTGKCPSSEGCLSVPAYNAEIERSEEVTLEAQDVDGNKVVYEADGLLAICMQHELDHLNGILFIDYLSSIKRERLLSKYTKLKKEHRV